MKRRDFLAGAGFGPFSVMVFAQGPPAERDIRAAISSYSAPAQVSPPDAGEPNMRVVDLGCDVLVAGGGLAGVCAALAAARKGAKSGGGNNAPSGLYPAKGGGPNDYIYITTSRANPEHWSRLMKLVGREELIDDPRFATGDAAPLRPAPWPRGRPTVLPARSARARERDRHLTRVNREPRRDDEVPHGD